MSCGTLVWVGVVILCKDGRNCINEVMFFCGMSGFCAGVNGRRERGVLCLLVGTGRDFRLKCLCLCAKGCLW